jgi:PTH1 family peptidyl-tRNA hydrolase
MKLVVGLGNPGGKYKNNRHNVGHMLLDYLSEQSGSKKNVKLVKTDCFMNKSGIFVKKLIKNSKLSNENLFIVHDDLDIPLGKFHIQYTVGPRLHNGLESIEQHLKNSDFWRVRIGVDNRPARRGGDKDKWVDGEAYVLSDFKEEEKKILIEQVFPKILSQLKQSHEMY